jgi:CheY-like chemotaxis protein
VFPRTYEIEHGPEARCDMAKKILLVDDSATSRLTNRMVISSKTSHEVVTAASGEDALKLVDSEKPDLILMDVMMPGIDGLEVCRRLRQEQATAKLPIVLLTFLVDESSVSQGLESGCTVYLKKPIGEEDLLGTLRKYLGD